ncbi:SOS response-associated peptidase family protein [Paenibacillus sp. FSL H7-0756]
MLELRQTVAQKPAFKRLLKSKRCIIPADGFYEWKKDGLPNSLPNFNE